MNLTTLTATRLRTAPRAADLVLAGDPTLDEWHRVDWTGAAPTIHERDGEIEIRYTARGRMRALSPRRGSLALRLSTTALWMLEIAGGVSGMRADLRDLRLTAAPAGSPSDNRRRHEGRDQGQRLLAAGRDERDGAPGSAEPEGS